MASKPVGGQYIVESQLHRYGSKKKDKDAQVGRNAPTCTLLRIHSLMKHSHPADDAILSRMPNPEALVGLLTFSMSNPALGNNGTRS